MREATRVETPLAPGVPAPARAGFAFIFVTVVHDRPALGAMIPVPPKLVVEFLGDAGAVAIDGLFGTVGPVTDFVLSHRRRTRRVEVAGREASEPDAGTAGCPAGARRAGRMSSTPHRGRGS